MKVKPKLYKNKYEFYIIDEDDYVVDTFYNVNEFKESYPELASGDKYRFNNLVSHFFTKKRKYFTLHNRKYTIEFQEYEEGEE